MADKDVKKTNDAGKGEGAGSKKSVQSLLNKILKKREAGSKENLEKHTHKGDGKEDSGLKKPEEIVGEDTKKYVEQIIEGTQVEQEAVKASMDKVKNFDAVTGIIDLKKIEN